MNQHKSCLRCSLPLGQIGHVSRDIVTILIGGDEAGAEHIGKGLLLLRRHLLLGLGVLELLLEAVNRLELFLEGLRFGMRCHLRVQDLLSRFSPNRSLFHPKV